VSEILIIAIGLFLIYIISCTLVAIYRKLRGINSKLSSAYAVLLAIVLISISIWAYYPSYTRSLKRQKDSALWCNLAMAHYCDEWSRCNFNQECRPKDMPFDEFEKYCVEMSGFKDLRSLNATECG